MLFIFPAYLEACPESDTVELARECICYGDDCRSGRLCYDGACRYSPCPESDTMRLGETCNCYGDNCYSGTYCYDGACQPGPSNKLIKPRVFLFTSILCSLSNIISKFVLLFF